MRTTPAHGLLWLAACVAVVPAALLAVSLPPSATFLNQAAALSGWGVMGAALALGLHHSTDASARLALPPINRGLAALLAALGLLAAACAGSWAWNGLPSSITASNLGFVAAAALVLLLGAATMRPLLERLLPIVVFLLAITVIGILDAAGIAFSKRGVTVDESRRLILDQVPFGQDEHQAAPFPLDQVGDLQVLGFERVRGVHDQQHDLREGQRADRVLGGKLFELTELQRAGLAVHAAILKAQADLDLAAITLNLTGFGDQLMFADADQDEEVFSCRAPAGTPKGGLEVGLEPIHCSAWQVLRVLTDEQRAEMDKQMARFEERMKGRKDG